MKYFIITFFLILSYFTVSFTVISQNKLRTGFYYFAEKENDGELIKNIDSEDVFAVERNEILSTKDFTSANFATRNFQPNPIKVIELKLNKDGRKKWIEIQNRMSKTGESILFICNDKVYLEKTIIGKSNLENSKIDLLIEPKYQESIFEIINSEINENR